MREPIDQTREVPSTPPEKVRAGTISGKVFLVLSISLALSLIAMALLLFYQYSAHPTP